MQTLDLSQNSLSGRVPANMLVNTLEVFPHLHEMDIFRQRGSRLCAHLTGNELSQARSLDGSLLPAHRVFPADQKSGMHMNSESSACECSRLWLNITSAAADYVNVGPDMFLKGPPIFSWPSEVNHTEVFVGLCDLPEMLGLMCEPVHASRCMQLYKFSQYVISHQTCAFVQAFLALEYIFRDECMWDT